LLHTEAIGLTLEVNLELDDNNPDPSPSLSPDPTSNLNPSSNSDPSPDSSPNPSPNPSPNSEKKGRKKVVFSQYIYDKFALQRSTMAFCREHLLDNNVCGSLTSHLATRVHDLVLKRRENTP
jgi:hypothetical protein